MGLANICSSRKSVLSSVIALDSYLIRFCRFLSDFLWHLNARGELIWVGGMYHKTSSTKQIWKWANMPKQTMGLWRMECCRNRLHDNNLTEIVCTLPIECLLTTVINAKQSCYYFSSKYWVCASTWYVLVMVLFLRSCTKCSCTHGTCTKSS